MSFEGPLCCMISLWITLVIKSNMISLYVLLETPKYLEAFRNSFRSVDCCNCHNKTVIERKPPRRDVATRFTKLSEKKFKILEELPLAAETVERPLVLIGG
ncbi:hypothetical protein H5410_010377 [Solanum commersonii]|uniref:Uncharacterized protein n=1 Tax=Solanum commersonii TaxID=4109 RepID=A0A9J6AM93_SOLCO|nr:hypothetical protein H5410_010377 [Solanum commersonii]